MYGKDLDRIRRYQFIVWTCLRIGVLSLVLQKTREALIFVGWLRMKMDLLEI
jgi:hypothetical protein